MPLDYYVEVEYEGNDGILISSPVFDSINMPIEVQGKLIGQNAVQFITFFLFSVI